MTATQPATMGAMKDVQSLIVQATPTAFAALSSADSTRYQTSVAVFIGAPKTFHDSYLPQCHLIPRAQQLAIAGQQGRMSDILTVEIRIVVGYQDWWAAEQQILSLRDQMLLALATHTLGGATPGGAVVAMQIHPGRAQNAFTILTIGSVSYRTWSCFLDIEQQYTIIGGLEP